MPVPSAAEPADLPARCAEPSAAGTQNAVGGAAKAEAGETRLVAGHPLPERLRENHDPALCDWLGRLPDLVEELLERWRLTADAPFEPGGSSAWVAPVRDVFGAELVLKVAWAHDEARDEAAGITAWQDRGAVRIHRSERHGQSAALLLERIRPGTPLMELLTWPERDEVVAAVARRLWRPPSELVGDEAAAAFRPLAQMCAWWADAAQERADSGLSPLPRDLVDHGLRLFRELPMQWDGEAVLLATDLHPENVLASAAGTAGAQHTEGAVVGGSGTRSFGQQWVLIDPKPYVGDPHYDVLQHMFNDPDRLRDRPGPFADRMAELAGLDPSRVRRWLLARCVQEAGVMDAARDAALKLVADGVE